MERSHRDLKSVLKGLCAANGQDWEENLPAALFALRTARNRQTGFTPHQVLFGREAAVPVDIMFERTPDQYDGPHVYVDEIVHRLRQGHQVVRKNLQLAQERARQFYQASPDKTKLQAGDLVWLFTPKLKTNSNITGKFQTRWTGPWQIVKKISEVLYQIKTTGQWNCEEVEATVGIDRLKRYRGEERTSSPAIGREEVLLQDEFLENLGQTDQIHPGETVEVTMPDPIEEIKDLPILIAGNASRHESSTATSKEPNKNTGGVADTSSCDNKENNTPTTEATDEAADVFEDTETADVFDDSMEEAKSGENNDKKRAREDDSEDDEGGTTQAEGSVGLRRSKRLQLITRPVFNQPEDYYKKT